MITDSEQDSQTLEQEAPPPAPVTVDLDKNEVVEEPASETPPAPKPRTMPRPQARIQELTHERDQERNYNVQLQNELAAARREAAEAKAGRENAERVGMSNYVQQVKSEITAAKQELTAAKTSGNPTAEVDAQERLARAAAAATDVEAWEIAEKRKAAAPQPQQQQQPQQPQQRVQEPPPLSEPVRDFVVAQKWFHPVLVGDDGRPVRTPQGQMIQNPEYDEDMHDAAMLVHKQIAREIRLGKLPKDFVETPEYFSRITEDVAGRFPDAFEGGEQEPEPQTQRRTPPMAQTRQPVAPASRNSMPGNTRTNGTKLTLDGEQAELVRSLVDNGTMRYPRNHPDVNKRGQKMEYKDAYLKYAQEYKTDQAGRSGNQNQ